MRSLLVQGKISPLKETSRPQSCMFPLCDVVRQSLDISKARGPGVALNAQVVNILGGDSHRTSLHSPLARKL